MPVEPLTQTPVNAVESEHRGLFRLLLEGVKDYDLILLDSDGDITAWYGGLERCTDSAMQPQAGQNISAFYPPEDVRSGRPERELADALVNGRIEREGWWLREDGTRSWVELVITARKAADDSCLGYSVVYRDITERKHAKLALQSVVDFSTDALITINEHGSIQSYAGSAQKIFGYTPSEVIGRNVNMLIPEPWRSEHDTYIGKYVRTGQAKVIGLGREVVGQRKDGSRVPLDLTITQFALDGSRFFTGILRDISDRKAAQDQLRLAAERAEQANSVKGEFLANMSHEIRTPLTAILGYCEILRDESLAHHASQHQLETIETIRRAGEHLLAIINDILDLSKLDAGKLFTEQVKTSLPQILSEVDSVMQPRISGKGVELRMLLETAIPDVILCDPTRLRQILLNLVGNAAKFTESGYIFVRTRVDRSVGAAKLHIEVEDTGMGMTAEQSAALFVPFSQADASITRKNGGTGLGLTISRRLARLMGGDVQLDYSIPGKATRFVLELPLIPAPNCVLLYDLAACSSERNETMPEAMALLSGRVLLAEDGADNRRLISFHLKRFGFEVELAENGRIALAMLESATANGCPFDLLVTDMQMPEMDGYTLAKSVRKRGSQIPIIALTAHAMAEDRQKCLDAGCDDYASKPVKKDELLAICRKWMEHSGNALKPAMPVIAPPHWEAGNPADRMQILESEYANDPDMATLLIDFLKNLGARAAQASDHLASKRLTDLASLAHQLKGASGGYGFPAITDAAQQVEQLANDDPDWERLQTAVAELTRLCAQAVTGIARYNATVPMV